MKVEITMEEILAVGVARMALHWLHGYDLLQALKRELLSSGFSADGTLLSASTDPHDRNPNGAI